MGLESKNSDYDYVCGIILYHDILLYCKSEEITVIDGQYFKGFYFTIDEKRYNIFVCKDTYLYAWVLTTEIIKLLCKYGKIKRLLKIRTTRIRLFEILMSVIKIIFGEIKEWKKKERSYQNFLNLR